MALSAKEINELEEQVKYSSAGRNNPFIGMTIDQNIVNRLFVRSLVSGRYDMFNYFLQFSIPRAYINSLRCESLTKGEKPCIEDYLKDGDFNIGDPIFKECQKKQTIPDGQRLANAHHIIQQIVKDHPDMLKTINIPVLVLAAHFGDHKTLEDVLKTPDKYCDINTSMRQRPTNVLKILVSSGDTQLFKKLLQHPQIKPGNYSIGLNTPIMSNKGLQHATVLLSALYEHKHNIHPNDLEELLGPSLPFFANQDKKQAAQDFSHILSKIIRKNPDLKTVATSCLTTLKEGGMLEDLSKDKRAIIDNMQKAIEAPSRESKVKIILRKIKSAMDKFTKLPSKAYNKSEEPNRKVAHGKLYTHI